LEAAHDDEPERARAALHPGDGEQDGEEGEDGEAKVEGPGAAVDVAKPAKADDEHGGDDEESEDEPEQVVGVARLERIDRDALEDVRERDEQDRRVDGGDEYAKRGVGERDPLVVRRDGVAMVVESLGGLGGGGFDATRLRLIEPGEAISSVMAIIVGGAHRRLIVATKCLRKREISLV
jgi:hypothetical protein